MNHQVTWMWNRGWKLLWLSEVYLENKSKSLSFNFSLKEILFFLALCVLLWLNFLFFTRYIIVVEHDLSVLDYLSDFICVLYGTPGAYGVVTLPFTVREGNFLYYGNSPVALLRGVTRVMKMTRLHRLLCMFEKNTFCPYVSFVHWLMSRIVVQGFSKK